MKILSSIGKRNYEQCRMKLYCFEREALAVVLELKKFCHYLLSAEPFALITDHKALRPGFEKKDVHGCLVRGLDLIADYQFNIVYQSGT